MEEETKDLFKKCYNQALNHLARKDWSEYKLSQKLKTKGYESNVIDEVVIALKERNFLREDLYKEARIKGFLRKGYSPRVIQYRLSQEFCDSTIEEIEEVAYQSGMNQNKQLQELIEKKVRIDYDFVPDKRKLKDRTLRYAANRGHNISQASQIFDQVIDALYNE